MFWILKSSFENPCIRTFIFDLLMNLDFILITLLGDFKSFTLKAKTFKNYSSKCIFTRL